MKTPSTPVQKCNCKNHIGNFMPLDCRQCAEYHGYEYQPSESKGIEKLIFYVNNGAYYCTNHDSKNCTECFKQDFYPPNKEVSMRGKLEETMGKLWDEEGATIVVDNLLSLFEKEMMSRAKKAKLTIEQTKILCGNQ